MSGLYCIYTIYKFSNFAVYRESDDGQGQRGLRQAEQRADVRRHHHPLHVLLQLGHQPHHLLLHVGSVQGQLQTTQIASPDVQIFARLRESRLLAPSGRQGVSHNLLQTNICVLHSTYAYIRYRLLTLQFVR